MHQATMPAMMVAVALLLAAAAPVSEPAFTPVQRDLLAMPGSLSNAWADFDNDGDLDLGVTLKSGEIRLSNIWYPQDWLFRREWLLRRASP